jgi:hypothetical protein
MSYLKRLQSARPTTRGSFAVEPLEERVLPSGITLLPTKKVSFLDADGDKVTIKAKGDLFQISLLGGATDNADVDTITILPGKTGVYDPNASLTVQVKAGKFSGGTTEIAHLTMLDQAGAERLGAITLNNALVDELTLPGGLTKLTANNTDFGNVVIAGALGSMVIGNHDLTGTISALSIGTITNIGPLTGGDIAGNVISTGAITKIITNRITGSVTAGGTIGTLATAEDLDGAVEATGGTVNAVIGRNLDGSLVVHNGNLNLGTLTIARVDGDVTGNVQVDGTLISGLLPLLSINANGNLVSGASISSSGHLIAKANEIQTDLLAINGDVTFAMKTGGLTTAVTAGDDVFGDGASGAIVIRGGNLSGQINAGGDISAITLNPNTLGITGSLTAGGNIGNITTHFFNGASLIAGFGTSAGSIGNLNVDHSGSNGGVSTAILDSSFTAATSIGNITVKQTGGDTAIDQSVFQVSNGSLGTITAETTGTGSAIRGTTPFPAFSASTTIGTISAKAVSSAAIASAVFQAGGNFGNITATSGAGDGFDASSFVSIGGSLGTITGSSVSGVAIDGSTFQASGSIGVISGTSTTGEAINASTFRADTGTISNITGRVSGAASSADAISDSNFTSGSTIGDILGDAKLGSGIANTKVSAEGNITSITGKTTNADTTVNEDGIQDSVFRTNASILKITGSTGVNDGELALATESEAMDGSVFSALVNILAPSGATIIATGDIQFSTFLAGYDIGGNLALDGLAGLGSDDILGDAMTPVQIGDITSTSDIVGSFFASGVGTDNNIIGDNIVFASDDFLNALNSSIGNITVAGVIAGEAGFIPLDELFRIGPRSAFSSDHIGLITADAISMSDSDSSAVASVGISTKFNTISSGVIDGIIVHTSSRAHAIGDSALVTPGSSLGFIEATNLSPTAETAISNSRFGAWILTSSFFGDADHLFAVNAQTPNSTDAVPISGSMFLFDEGNPDNFDLGIGNINAVAANVAGSVAIEQSFFGTGSRDNIIHIGAITTIGDVQSSTFGLGPQGVITAGDIGNLTGGAGINVQGSIIDSIIAGTGSLAVNGGITIAELEEQRGFAEGSIFIGFAGVGNIFVEGINEAGAGVTDSQFATFVDIPGGGSIGSITIKTGSVESSFFGAGENLALTGGITIFGNTVHKDFGLLDSTLFAHDGDIGSITIGPSGLAKNQVGTEISGSTIAGVNIAIGMDGDIARAITIHGNNTGDAMNRAPGEAGLSIFDSMIIAADPNNTAGIGSIGHILIGQSPGDNAGGGIAESHILANLNLGDVKLRINITDADEDISGIRDSEFRGQSAVTTPDLKTAGEEFGSIGEIVVRLTGLPSTQDVITGSTFSAGPNLTGASMLSLGNVTLTTDGIGSIVTDSTFRTSGPMGALFLRAASTSTDAVVNTTFSALGVIGSDVGNNISVRGNVVGSRFLAGYDIGADLIQGNELNPASPQAVALEFVVDAGGEAATAEPVFVNRISVDGNLIESDIIVGIDPGYTGGGTFDDTWGNTAPLMLDAMGNPLDPLGTDDIASSEDGRIGTIQVQGGIYTQGTDLKEHSIAAGFIGAFQQPNNVTHKSDLPGFLDNGGGSLDVRIQGEPSGAPVFLTSRDFAGREVDFNQDGDNDLIMLDSRTNQLKVFYGNGIGAFESPVVFGVGNAPVWAVIGNFNGDVLLDDNGVPILDGSGNVIPALDIVVLNSLTDGRAGVTNFNTIDIFFADPVGGTFSEDGHQIVSLGFGSRTLTSIAASDFVDVTSSNSPVGDGFLDLVITNATDNVVRLLRNTDANNDGVADGIFLPTAANNFAVGAGPTGISVTPPLSVIAPETIVGGSPDAHIDAGDDLDELPGNAPDAVVANATDNTISVLFGSNTGDGQFQLITTVAVGATPLQTVLADVDNDNDIDILVVNFGSDSVSVLLNNGLGGFGASVTLAVGAAPRGIVVGDFNGDNLIDFATADSGADTVSVVLNTDGIFTGAVATAVTLTGSPLAITSADYNNDGFVDLAVTNADLAQAPVVLENDGTGTFTVVA